MYLKGGVVLLFLVLFGCSTIAITDTCGAPQTGVFLEDFHGSHSYVSYNIEARYMKENSLEYQDRFCTKNGSGIIAKITSNVHREDILIEVVDDQLEIHLIKDGAVKPGCIYTVSQIVTDGVNYLFKVGLKKKKLKMTLYRKYSKIYSVNVEDIGPCLESNFSSFSSLEKGGEKVDGFYSERIQLTVLHRGKPYLYGDFDGCIGDSMINGIPIAKAGTEIEKHDIDPTCMHSFGPECTDICRSSYAAAEGKNCACPNDSEVDHFGLCVESCNCFKCQNGGTCTNSGSDVRCRCPPGYEGKYCELDSCRKLECLNGGSCTVQPSGPVCICLSNFTGVLCEVFVPPPEDPCEGSPCQNSATCVPNSTLAEKYFCYCPDGYYGKLCENQNGNSGTTMSPTTLKIVYAVTGVVGGIIAALVTALIVCLKRRWHRETDNNTPSDNSNS